jgi:NAD(P)-dependent dehydrogenase (short-subunit alcohol dehydrogenase family)
MPEADWRRDMAVNLDQPFFLARAAMKHMAAGGRIVLNGTESALHGGSATSFPYAIAKRGTEAMVQGLAREGAPSGILVNGVRFGYIASGFHERWHGRTRAQMDERRELVPLKRAGDPAEAAALIVWLLSGWSSFVTGQMFALTGGDWL